MQLSLAIGLRDDASFDNFHPGSNELVVNHLRQLLETTQSEGSVFLWGQAACGKTHLLQALCQAAGTNNNPVVYLPLKQWREMDVGILESLEQYPLICLDDIDSIVGQISWEQELFHLYNRIFEKGSQLVVSASHALQNLPIELPDLKSRLGWGFVFQLKELAEDEKIQALQLRAKRRGFDLPDEVASYLLRRSPRDLASLFGLLNQLDKASLTAQRRLTVPFVRQCLKNQKGAGV